MAEMMTITMMMIFSKKLGSGFGSYQSSDIANISKNTQVIQPAKPAGF